MIRASAKNFLRVASVVDPSDYLQILSWLKENNGCTSLDIRYKLACKAFGHTAEYDAAITDFFKSISFDEVRNCYRLTL
jgi:phosphoribosylaminoimidazolecarboxamide formyltransferase / IMP cyclohydrolase